MSGIKQLNPSCAVETTMSGICGWKCSSLISFWPYPSPPPRIITACTNSSCDGTSGIWSAASASSERSQMVSCWSLDTASTDESCGDHSTDVIGASS